MSVLNLLLGIILLLFGRSLYWVFVAVAGFLVGVELGTQLLADQADWVRVLAAVLCGILGAILGMLAQRVAFSIGGLFAGGYLGLAFARAAGTPGEPLVWFAIGGILGAVIAVLVMDWAIIVLSSLAGAAAIVGQFDIDATLATLLFVVLMIVGIIIQARRLRTVTAAD
jgi:hypothetical protein